MNLYVYRRVSTFSQNAEGKDSLKLQVKDDLIKKLTSEHSLSNVVELEATIGSAFHGSHIKVGSVLNTFINECKEGKHKGILAVYSLDRLSRLGFSDGRHTILDPILMSGVKVYSQLDNQLFEWNDLKSSIMADLIFSRANEESSTKKMRVEDAILAGVNKYLSTGERTPNLTKAPFWIDNSTCEFNQWEHAARYMVSLRLEGYGYKAIATKLQDKFPRKAERKNCKSITFWEQSKVSKILNNVDSLLGHKVVSVKGESYTLKNYYPTLLSQADALKITRKPKGRSASVEGNDLKALCKPKCSCGYALHKMERRGGKFSYFCSGASKGTTDCSRNYIGCDFVDKMVLSLSTLVIHHYTNNKTDDNELVTLQLELNTLKSSLGELSNRYKESRSMIVLDLITSTEKDIQELSQKIAKLQETSIVSMPNINQVSYWLEHWEDNRKVIKDCLQTIIDKVVIRRIDLVEGYSFEFRIESGDFWVNYKMTPDEHMQRSPSINIDFKGKSDYSVEEIANLSKVYFAGYDSVIRGEFFQWYKGVSKKRTWKDYHELVVSRIIDRGF
ncbi:recombinase family protein [Vibrio splendidus]